MSEDKSRERFLVLEGSIVPYVRMTQRSKFVDPRALRYLASQEALRYQMRQEASRQGWEIIPRKVPLGVVMIFSWAEHRMDLDNLVKAVLDAAQGVLIEDDRWVDSIHASRRRRGGRKTYLRIKEIET